MKDTFNKNLQSKSVLVFDSSEEITHFNNHDSSSLVTLGWAQIHYLNEPL